MLKRPFRSTQVLALIFLLLAPFTKSTAETRTTSPQQEAQRAVEAGKELMSQGQYDQAEHSFRMALERDPASFEAVVGLARALTETAEYAQAENLCQRSMRMAKDDPTRLSRVHQALGEVYSREGKSPAAMSAYYKAAELRPNDVDVTRGLANCAIRAGLYAEAVVAYTKLLRLQPLDLSAKKELAWVNFKLERYPLAISNYEAISDSLGTVDRYYLAQAYAKSNRVDRAVEQFREVVRLDKDNYKGVYCNMANAYYEANRYESAILVAHEGLQADSTSACLHFCWAQALDKLGRHKDAIPVFEAALDDPTYSDAAKKELERQRRIVRLLQSK
jgi:tetratricopeptide (TPR) repeat protein